MAVNIAYSSSESYSKCTGVSMLSLLENNADIENLNIYIFTTDMSTASKKKLLQIADSYDRQVTIIDVKEQLNTLANKYNLPTLGGAYNTYITLFASEWLDSIDKVLFIDSDTLVDGSIRDLYNISLDENLIAAAPDAGVYGKKTLVEDKEIINLGEKYFNAGIVLLNLKRWNEENTGQLIVKKILGYQNSWWNQEQSILNYSLYNRCKYFHLKYNYYTLFHLEDYETIAKHTNINKVFSKDEYNQATENPIIIHFIGLPYVRPWYEGNISPYKDLYLTYYIKSPWGNTQLDSFPKNPQLAYRLYDYIMYITLQKKWLRTHYFIREFFGGTLKVYLQMIAGKRR